jgi:hypothetical protein
MAGNIDEEHLDSLTNTQPDNSSDNIIPTTDTETTTQNQETENMEVHHHPDLHHKPKKWKEYFLEFLMLFLAVTLGFIAENIRENIVNREKEKHYVENIIADLKTDTSNITLSIHMQNLLLKKMEDVLKIPFEKLDDLSIQDTLYKNLVPFYASSYIFVQNNNTVTQLKNAGGFNLFTNQKAVDSISAAYYYSDSWIKINTDLYAKSYERTNDIATQLMRLPEAIYSFDDTTQIPIPLSNRIVIQHNIILFEQLYSNIRYQKGQLIICVETEKEYFQKVERLLKFLQSEYDLK